MARAHGEQMRWALHLLHRVLGVGEHVEEHLLQLVRVGHGVRDRLVVLAAHLDASHPQLVHPELQRVVDHPVDARGPLLDLVLPGEREQVLHDPRSAARFGVDRLDGLALVRGRALLGQQQLGERGDPRQGIVQLVGHPRDQLADRRHLLGLNQLLLNQLLVGDVADQAQHLFVPLRARVGDLDGPRLPVLAEKAGLEEPRVPRQRHLEMSQGLGEVVVGDHRREPLAHELLAEVAGDALRRVVHGGEPPVRIERHDGVGSGFEQVAVARLGTGQRLLRPFLVGDVPDRGDRADQLPVQPERGVRHRHLPELARGRYHGGLVALWLAAERLLLPGGNVRALARSHDVVHGEVGQLVERATQ